MKNRFLGLRVKLFLFFCLAYTTLFLGVGKSSLLSGNYDTLLSFETAHAQKEGDGPPGSDSGGCGSGSDGSTGGR